MMDTIYMDNNNNCNINRGGDYNYYNNNYPESHRGALSSWSSENVHPDSNFHRPTPSRRRPFPHGPQPDYSEDGIGFVKLYVAGIPRTSTQEEIRSLFEVHGNIVEIAILKDQRTGQQKECCFIKYTTLEEADRAIGALNNIYTFPGATLPIKVRYAQGKRERLGIAKPVLKLYVNYLNKQASKRDIGEIFSAYGDVEDIHILLDEFKQSRGCGFVQYAHSDMAIAAIDALNDKFVMMGCDQPLLVRFAHPKKPRVGDLRSNSKFDDTVVGSHFQEPVVRPVPYLNDSVALKVSNGSYQVSPKATASLSQSPQVGSKLDAISSILTALEPEDSLECDWSEHVCPDGYSYYYNCETCESRWEKPQEYALFEQQLQKQHELQQQEQQSSGCCKESHSPSTLQVTSMEQVPQQMKG